MTNQNQITVLHSKDLLTNDDISVLRNSKFKDFTDNEVAFAAKVCHHLSLNPLLNQIHFVKRKNADGTYAITTQVGIDGFRLAAQRTGEYAGSDDAIFEEKSGNPSKATVTVYRFVGGVRCPFTGSARWEEFFPGERQGHMWKKMPHNQLAKCAEALALRKAFPHELSSMRTDEEMAQAQKNEPTKAEILNARPPVEEAPFEPMSETPGEYVCKVHPFIDSKVSDIPLDRLKKFVEYCSKKEKPTLEEQSLFLKAKAFLAEGGF